MVTTQSIDWFNIFTVFVRFLHAIYDIIRFIKCNFVQWRPKKIINKPEFRIPVWIHHAAMTWLGRMAFQAVPSGSLKHAQSNDRIGIMFRSGNKLLIWFLICSFVFFVVAVIVEEFALFDSDSDGAA